MNINKHKNVTFNSIFQLSQAVDRTASYASYLVVLMSKIYINENSA